ncbi:uncharacterized protein EDB93DRAFT_300919 [Suillus bovinus]|uniref:uncharacterized protein n=1 Tax=Suillus bovinus TaxID=48563 RepID=UPI001B8614C5|nr:uncharacterized protein EDB93DRAFT_300919 [Suillus bovinus]KAG2151189.1 hypothetical protein EDB93DRAFT_300919 [Suillus bovinus]
MFSMLRTVHLIMFFMIYKNILCSTMLYTTRNITNLCMQQPKFFLVGCNYHSPPTVTVCVSLLRTCIVACPSALRLIELLLGKKIYLLCLRLYCENPCFVLRTKFSSMSDDILFESLSTVPVPPGCATTRGTLLAAEFHNLYGPEVATALRTPPVISVSLAIDSAAMRASEAMSLLWISASVDDLTSRLEKLRRTDVQLCIHQLAPRYRTLYNRLSHRKTCNVLAGYVRQRALSLFHAGASILGDIYLAYFPFLTFDSLSDQDIFHQIITHEFGALVTERLSHEIVSRSVKHRTLEHQTSQRCPVQ